MVEGSFEPKAIYREDTDNVAPPAIGELLLVASEGDAGSLEKAAERGRIMGEGANIARRLSICAANDVSPQVLADEASALASEHGLWIDVVDEKRAKELGMGMFLAVGQGSDNPPRMIVMRAGGEGDKDLDGLEVTIVGSMSDALADPRTGLGMSSSDIGVAGAVYVAGACLGALFFGQLTDRFGRKKLFLITLGVYTVGDRADGVLDEPDVVLRSPGSSPAPASAASTPRSTPRSTS